MNLQPIVTDLECLLADIAKPVKTNFYSGDKIDFANTKKDRQDLVTKFDTENNKIICEYLRKTYPDYSIVSEEDDPLFGNSEYAFVVDPIDGTRNFIKRIPQFHIGIGLVKIKDKHSNNTFSKLGETVASVTINPATDEIYSAIKDNGAFCNGEKISVSSNNCNDATVGVWVLNDRIGTLGVLTKIMEHIYHITNPFCAHHELSNTACGKYEAKISKGCPPWDYCHYLLVQEAGGKVTNWEGNPYDNSMRDIIASNGVFHDELVRLISRK
jgi:myo-inositol-1(or 4)-monophosphatase